MDSIDYSSVPVDYMSGALRRYIEMGMEPGGFMQALLSNDLRGAVLRADGMNIAHIPHWVAWLENNLPPDAWGSVQSYENWVAARRDAAIKAVSDFG